LSWTTFGASSCSINQGVGSVGLNSSAQVSPTATTTYTLTCVGPGGSAQKSLTVSVGGSGVIEIQP
jgi:hypothetical protein